VIAVRVARDKDHRRASANVETASVAAARTLNRSRNLTVRVVAIAASTPTMVTTTISSGRVVPRRMDLFR